MQNSIPLLSKSQVTLVKLMRNKAALTEALFPVFRIKKDKSADGIVLSYAQQRLWFLHTSSNENSFYNEPILLELDGTLDVAGLKWALTLIQQRHEILRTKFQTIDGVPLQRVNVVDEFPIEVVDLSKFEPAVINDRVKHLYQNDAMAELDLFDDNLCKATLIKIAENKHKLIFFMHHIISDGWSMSVLLNELKIYYSKYLGGDDQSLLPLPIQYSDYALWEKHVLTGRYLDKLADFWKKELQGANQRISLPRDRSLVEKPSFKGDRISIELSQQLSEKIVALSGKLDENVTLFITLLSVFYIGLNYLGDDHDICVGTDVANRPNAESEQLIGFFVNQLVLRCKVNEDDTFKQLVSNVRDLSYRAFEHQAFPFDRLVDSLKHDRVVGVSPIFQVKFVLQNTPMQALQLPGLELTLKPHSRGTSKFELLLDLTLKGSIIEGWLEYSLESFEPSTARRIVDVFENILPIIVDNPSGSISQIKAQVKRKERLTRQGKRKLRSKKALNITTSERTSKLVSMEFE